MRMRQRRARNREFARAQRREKFEDILARYTYRAKLAQNLKDCAPDSRCIPVQLFLSMMSRRPSLRETLYRAVWRGKVLEFLALPLISGEIFENPEEGSLRDRIDIQVTCKQGTKS